MASRMMPAAPAPAAWLTHEAIVLGVPEPSHSWNFRPALARPADAVFPAELLLAGELAVELPDELHAARAASEPITAADDSHRLPGSLIAHASKRSGSRP